MTANGFHQIEPQPWPSGHGEAVAVLSHSPEALETRYGLRFFAGDDNLDTYAAAAIRLESGRRVGLIRHRGTPALGTELHVDATDDFLEAIREFLDAFDLTADELAWVRDDVPLDHLRLAVDSAGR